MPQQQLDIFVYGDSISMPRPDDTIRHFETYPELLRDLIVASRPGVRVTVLNRSSGGVPIRALHARYLQDLPGLGKDHCRRILVIQCGIVDCAPRPVSPAVRALISRLPLPLRWAVIKLLHVARPWLLGAGLKWRATGIDEFRSILDNWVRDAARTFARVYVINVAPTVPDIEARSPGLQASIDAYNRVIAKIVTVADPSAIALVDAHAAIAGRDGELALCINAADGHHITRRGHRLYAEMIFALEARHLER